MTICYKRTFISITLLSLFSLNAMERHEETSKQEIEDISIQDILKPSTWNVVDEYTAEDRLQTIAKIGFDLEAMEDTITQIKIAEDDAKKVAFIARLKNYVGIYLVRINTKKKLSKKKRSEIDAFIDDWRSNEKKYKRRVKDLISNANNNN